MQIAIVLNTGAGNQRAKTRFFNIQKHLEEKLGPYQVLELSPQVDLCCWVKSAMDQGVRRFVAAGGDGTVHLLLNAIVQIKRDLSLDSFFLGALGLGSSNDFHKPICPKDQIGGIPARIEFQKASPHDIGVASYVDDKGKQQIKFFLVNASVGLTAEANHFFNSKRWLLNSLKGLWVAGAIQFAALRTLVRYRNLQGDLQLGEQDPTQWNITNLSVMKIPYLSGSFHYDTPVAPNDGLFAVNLCHDMNRRAVIRMMKQLSHGKFLNWPKTKAWRVEKLVLNSAQPFAVEMDGEVVSANQVQFHIYPECIKVCDKACC